jgi:hypothetical protein
VPHCGSLLQAAGLSIGERRLTARGCRISSGVARTSQLATLLWMSTATWLAGCGRLWFQGPDKDPVGSLPDAPPMIDAAVVDAGADAAVDAPDDVAIASAPVMDVAPMLTTTVSCGAAPQQASLTVTNKGNADLQITNATITGAPFQLKAIPLMIAPGAMASFSILPPMAIVGTDLGGDVKHGTLKIESNAGNAMVDLEATILGANLVMTPMPPQPLTFQGSSGACPSSQQVSIQNMGNSTASVDANVTGPFGFGFSSSSDRVLSPGETLIIDVHVVTSSACSGSGSVGFIGTSSSICQISGQANATYNILGSSSGCSCS